MRVAVFSLAYDPLVGGAELAIKEITDRIPDKNFCCFTHRFDENWPEREQIGNVSVVRLGRNNSNISNQNSDASNPSMNPVLSCSSNSSKILSYSSCVNYYGHFWQKVFYVFRAWRAAEELHRQSPFDAIWGIMAAYGGIAALLFKLRHPSVPFLLTLQEGDSESHILRRVGIFYPFWRLIFKKADRIQAISRYLADFAKRHGARCPIEVVPNGVDLGRYKANYAKSNANDAKKLNDKISQNSRIVSQRSHYIITTSRLVHKNGIDTLIRAIAVIASEAKQSQGDRHGLKPRDDIKLQILGSGPDEQKLKNLAAELGIADKVEFLGHVEPDQIPSYLLQSAIFVRPSRSEGLGSSFLEAMAAGLPIIGTAVGGIPDFLKDYNANDAKGNANHANGLFVEVDDPRDLAGKITLLLRDEKLRKELGENGRKLVLENYSWDKISEKMRNIFSLLTHQLINSSTPKLLIATGLYPPEIGGPATYTALVEAELSKRGFRVSVLPFRLVRKWPPAIRHLLYFFVCFFRALKADLVYAQDPVSVGLPAMLAAKITRRPFLIRVAGDYAWEQSVQRFGVRDSIDDFQNKKYGFRTELLRTVQKFVVNKADKVITPSNYFRNLVSRWIQNPDIVITIYNGIDLRNQESGIRNQENKEKTILSAGRLVPWKGFEVLVEIMKDLPDWKLIIVGDGPEKTKLQLLITNYQLQNRVILTGSLPREELLDYLLKAAIFVLNTSFESFSFQVVEAMNAGVPVITTDVCDLGEIIENGKEGILVEPDNKKQLLAAIKKITEDKDFREKIIENAKIKVQSFSVEKTAEELSETIKSLKK